MKFGCTITRSPEAVTLMRMTLGWQHGPRIAIRDPTELLLIAASEL